MKKRRLFDRTGGPAAFKRMARAGGPVELSHAKASVQEAARELGIDSSRITKWRQSHKNPTQSVTAVMHKEAIRSIMYKKYRVQTTDSAHDYPVAKNLLNREFTAEKPGQKWVSAITYIPPGEGWLYLTTILDLADRKVVGWALSVSLKAADTSVAAWRMALKNRAIGGSLLFHRSGDLVRSGRSLCVY